MKTKLFSALVIIIYCLNATAQITWQQTNGPYGGLFSVLVANKNTGNLFGSASFDHRKVGGSGGNLYRSRNNGASWFKADNGLKLQRVTKLAIDPVNAAKMYACVVDTLSNTKPMGIYYSNDTANTWTLQNNTTFSPGTNSNTISSLIADPSNNAIYAGRNKNGVYRSFDNGINWAQINTGLTDTIIRAMCLGSQGFLYAATAGTSASVFCFNGTSWTNMSGLPGNIVSSLTYYAASATMYAGTTTGSAGNVYKSVNGGNWTLVSGYTTTGGDGVLKVEVNSAGDLYVLSLTQGVFRYSGGTWTAMSTGLSALSTMSFFQMAIDNADNVLIADRAGILKMPVAGSWSRFNSGLIASTGRCFVNNAAGEIVLGTENGIYVSPDGGNSWNYKSLADKTIFTVGMNPVTGTLIAGRHLGTIGGTIFRSTDDGQTWANTQTGFTGIAAVTFDYTSAGKLFLGTGWGGSGQSVYTSVNDGVSWTNSGTTSNLPAATVAVSLTIDKTSNDVYLGLEQFGVYKSTNSGLNYTSASPFVGGDVGQVGLTPQKDLYASHLLPNALCGLYRYKKYNNTWSPLPLYSNGFVNCFVIAGNDSVYIGTNTGIYLSSDTAVTWTQLNSGLDNLHVHSLFIGADNYMYAGIAGGGVYKSNVPVKGTLATTQNALTSKEHAVSVFPNPSTGLFSVQFESSETAKYKLEIFNALGENVYKETTEVIKGNNRITVDQNLKAGIYFIKINGNSGYRTQKLVVN
ncbi:MAG: T9SS type A sorting domain-containing protein [Bacteroidia bacterium]|nr:T9SS type A sorting domain-containing protein [Bacteroidia bacterium]